jgi:hypothetical protein
MPLKTTCIVKCGLEATNKTTSGSTARNGCSIISLAESRSSCFPMQLLIRSFTSGSDIESSISGLIPYLLSFLKTNHCDFFVYLSSIFTFGIWVFSSDLHIKLTLKLPFPKEPFQRHKYPLFPSIHFLHTFPTMRFFSIPVLKTLVSQS